MKPSHENRSYVYMNTRPQLSVEHTGGRHLGNCYYATSYKVTSLKRLSRETVKGLFDLGFMGYGQEFNVISPCDGKEPPAGTDEVPCTTVDRWTNKPTGEPAINPYSGLPYGPSLQEYFVYECESRCDSGD